MEFEPQWIPEVILIRPTVHGDARGYFMETFHQNQLEQGVGFSINFLQDNESCSARGVLRGLHYQIPPHAQSKLVRVIKGRVLDVAVDIRAESPTFGEHVAVELSAENRYQLWIPRGFAHGFVVLSEYAIFSYKVDNYYAPRHDRGFAYDDPSLHIDWQLSKKQLSLSLKDQQLPRLKQVEPLFLYESNLYE